MAGGMIQSHSAWALIIACGKSEQLSTDADTAYLQLGDQPVLSHSLIAFERCPEIEGIVVIAAKDRVDNVVGMARMYGTPKLKKIAVGAVQKTTSIRAGLKALEDVGASLVVIHEASQPCVTPTTISETIKNAKRYGVSVAGDRIEAPVTVVPKGLKATKCINDNSIWTLHSPLAVKLDVLEKVLGSKAGSSKMDDTSFMERLCKTAHMVQIDAFARQIRTLGDIQIIAAALRK